MSVSYAFVLREVANVDDPPLSQELIDTLREHAAVLGKTLLTNTPTAGWAARFTRDGKEWPCPEATAGARPVWIWRAR